MRSSLKVIFIMFLLFLPSVLVVHLGIIDGNYLSIISKQILNTIIIVTSVVVITTSLGVLTAWIFALYNFPLKRYLEIILILGMVFPSYVLALFYSEAFKVWGEIALIGTLSVSTLPYVFMIVTMSLRSQSQQLVDTALMLGKNNHWIKLKVIWPLLKPAIVLSSLLVLGDTFSEFGATYFYGVDTIMTGIYEIWFGLHEIEQGIRFASWTFIITLSIYYFINTWKHSMIGQQPSLSNSGTFQTIQSENLSGIKGFIISLFIINITLVTFFIPFGVLGMWVVAEYTDTDWWRVFAVTLNSSMLATVIAMLVLINTTFILYLFKKRIPYIMSLSNTLYSTPGIILAVAAVYVINATHLEVGGILFIYVLTLKYLAMGTDSIGVGIQKVNRQYYYTTKTFGKDSVWYIWKIQIPMSMQSYLIAGILVWIDVIRELVIGLTLRPQWLDLLSVEIFRYMDMEQLSMSGPWILAMVIITIIPIYYIKIMLKSQN